jgi:hypothetical protein
MRDCDFETGSGIVWSLLEMLKVLGYDVGQPWRAIFFGFIILRVSRDLEAGAEIRLESERWDFLEPDD